ncbi:uncharacterized protein LOC114260058 isoform X2 [Camellia sinensis]|uniref:uncharacterized protein LOC114260058 isoform X2 n=1 Tax=Camellia sinensis TaxID=4442 RepID=UPI0010360F46|nr:uncharacterized protein LOC114260058 isoform X2 [Camellia sinensis]
MAHINESREATEKMNIQGGDHGERTVNTVDYRTSAGQAQEQEPVQVVHQSHLPTTTTNSNTSGGILVGAANAVASTLQSAKEAISGK